MRKIVIAVLLTILALFEISATGTLHERFGLYQLLGIYFLTTITGVIILLSQRPFVKKIQSSMSILSDDKQFSKDLKEALETDTKTPEVKRFGDLTKQFMIYIAGWVFILIPGLVTDLIGFLAIVVWFKGKSGAEKTL